MNRSTCLDAACRHFDEGHFLSDLRRRVAWRTESDTGTMPASLDDYLRNELVPFLEPLRFRCEIIPNPVDGGGPFLIARRVEDAARTTVLSYGHGDVISGQENRWRDGLSPWELHIEGDRWYGRGTADNKGQHSINLAALAAVIDARGGCLGYNLTLLIEMGEEAGSPGLRELCAERRESDLKADLFLSSDGPRVAAQRPTLFLGARGALNFELRLKVRERAYHSGNWGGALRNPGIVLAHALSSLVDARGRLLVETLRPSGIPPEVLEALRDIPLGGAPDDPEVDIDWGEPGLTPTQRVIGWNSLEVLAFSTGSPQRPVGAIPPMAQAWCQLRFVVGTRVADIGPALRAHLDAAGFTEVELHCGVACEATRLDPRDPWVEWALTSMQRTTGQRPALLPNLGGALPNDLFADILGLPTLWVPHSYPGCAQHAPNEHLLGSVAREGLRLMAGLFWDLGEDAEELRGAHRGLARPASVRKPNPAFPSASNQGARP